MHSSFRNTILPFQLLMPWTPFRKPNFCRHSLLELVADVDPYQSVSLLHLTGASPFLLLLTLQYRSLHEFCDYTQSPWLQQVGSVDARNFYFLTIYLWVVLPWKNLHVDGKLPAPAPSPIPLPKTFSPGVVSVCLNCGILLYLVLWPQWIRRKGHVSPRAIAKFSHCSHHHVLGWEYNLCELHLPTPSYECTPVFSKVVVMCPTPPTPRDTLKSVTPGTLACVFIWE